jgi:hypothetical protein
VTARTWVDDAGRGARFDRHVEFTGADGRVHVRARTTWAIVDKARGRAIRVPPEVITPFLRGRLTPRFDCGDDLGKSAAAGCKAHVRAIELDRVVPFAVLPPRAQGRDDAVPARPDGERRHRRLCGQVGLDRKRVDRMTRDNLIQPPNIVRPQIA